MKMCMQSDLIWPEATLFPDLNLHKSMLLQIELTKINSCLEGSEMICETEY